MKVITYIGKNKFFIEKYLPSNHRIKINHCSISSFELEEFSYSELIIVETDNDAKLNLLVVKKIKYLLPSVPIFLLTDGVNGIELRKAYRAGISEIIVLPEDHGYLGKLIDQLFSYQKNIGNARDSNGMEINNEREKLVSRLKTGQALDFIKNNYHKKLFVTELARICHMHVSSFSRKFREEHGCTIREYIKQVRIISAMHLLRKTKRSIENIAFDVGFETVSLFNRLFKQITGISPSFYRQAINH